MLVAALLGTPALASAQAPAHGVLDHAAVIELGALPQSSRPRRRPARGAKARVFALAIGRRLRDAAARIRAGREGTHRRLPPHDLYPRGPPRTRAD
jgi:hypothetical protein